jgi:thiamine kinase-like enzyme
MRPDFADATADERRAREQLAMLPGFSTERAAQARFTRLVGMTNRVYRVDAGGEAFCLRIPGDGVAAAIDRRAEEINARLAAKAGVAPDVLYFGEDGVMLTRFIENAETLRPPRILESAGALERAANALRRLHESGVEFAGRFEAFATIEKYVALLRRFGLTLSAREEGSIRQALAIGEAWAARPIASKPCHCDPTGRNLLDTGERVWLVDWEYSAMNDPMWDLAYFSIESLFGEAEDRRLLLSYLGREPTNIEAARMALLKPVAEVQAALWALIQNAEGNTGGDFKGYADSAFSRAAARMESPGIRAHLDGLLRG